jgi:hypothetical protein
MSQVRGMYETRSALRDISFLTLRKKYLAGKSTEHFFPCVPLIFLGREKNKAALKI